MFSITLVIARVVSSEESLFSFCDRISSLIFSNVQLSSVWSLSILVVSLFVSSCFAATDRHFIIMQTRVSDKQMVS
jgi:hypothetical protein